MSKIWILLLLVGAIQFASTFPALEEERDDIQDDLTELEDFVSEEERANVVTDWLKAQWQKMKKQCKKVRDKIKNCFAKGKKFLKDKGITMEPMTCAENRCTTCVTISATKSKKFCLQIDFSMGNIQMNITKQKDNEEPQTILGPFSKGVSETALCTEPLCSWCGPICLQGVEGKTDSKDGNSDVYVCGCAVFTNFSVGLKCCVQYKDGKVTMKFKPKLFAGDEDNGQIMEAGEKADEGSEIDAAPE